VSVSDLKTIGAIIIYGGPLFGFPAAACYEIARWARGRLADSAGSRARVYAIFAWIASAAWKLIVAAWMLLFMLSSIAALRAPSGPRDFGATVIFWALILLPVVALLVARRSGIGAPNDE
jgi:hypothetical protein